MSLPKTFPLKVAGGKTANIPTVGYGTWASGDTSWAKDSTLTALKEGYRHIDGAWWYGVDKPVGEALHASTIPREEIFYTTKVWPHFFAPENVGLCLDHVLEHTGLKHVDLLLAHWPFAQKPISRKALENASSGPGVKAEQQGQLEENGKPVIDWQHTSSPIAKKAGQEGSFVPTWQAMEELVRGGKAKAIGVSNFSIADLEALLPHVGDIPISCNQIEVHPWLPQTELIEFCKKHGIVVACYSPFAGQKNGKTLLQNSTVVEIAKKNEMDVGQLLQSWAVTRGTIPLGKSATPSRIKTNLDVRRLSDQDMKALDGLAKPDGEGRTVKGEGFGVPLF